MMTLKCNICKLSIETCRYKCTTVADKSSLIKEDYKSDDLDGFCTNHSCVHNANGFKCKLKECALL